MRSLILIAAALFIQQQAFAGFGQCSNRVDLVCEARVNLTDGTSKLLTSGVGRVYNQESEMFYPVDCEGSVTLDTDIGQFVANYKDYDGTVTATLNPSEGQGRLLFVSEAIDEDTNASATVPMLSDENTHSVTFTCFTQVNYQYQYRHNPRE